MGEKHIFHVGISGSYGGLNLGDEAILQSIITSLQNSLPVKITVFSRDAADTLSRHSVYKVIPVRTCARTEIVPVIENLDLFVLGGGGILFDGEARIFLREVQLALEKNVPVLIYSIGVGPLTNPHDQQVVRDCLNRVTAVTVREKDDKQLLEDIGINRPVIVTADPSFLLQPGTLPEGIAEGEHLTGERLVIGMSVREPGPAAPGLDESSYHALLANAADFMIDRLNASIVFVPMERPGDLQHSHAIMSKMLFPEHSWVLKGEYSSSQVLSLMKYFDFALGMRLHFLIFAAMQGIPFVALPYAVKVSGMLAQLNIATPPLHRINAGRLIAYIDKYWDNREQNKTSASSKLAGLREKARIPNKIAVEILHGQFNENKWTGGTNSAAVQKTAGTG
jgi:polysaccharide pyruvyl transferase CsaB